MTREEMKERCKEVFYELAEELKETHVVVKSCNKDESAYLVPKGTEDQITYSGKPVCSFRISDHWNWKTNLKKNPDPDYIQCHNVDLMKCKERKAPELASDPIWAWCVGVFAHDNLYHTLVGEIINPVTKKWDWCDIEERSAKEWADHFRKLWNM